MGYHYWDSAKKQQMRERILDAIKQLKRWNDSVGTSSEYDRGRDRGKGKDRRKIYEFMGRGNYHC